MVWIVCEDERGTVRVYMHVNTKVIVQDRFMKCCNHFLAVDMGVACREAVVYV